MGGGRGARALGVRRVEFGDHKDEQHSRADGVMAAPTDYQVEQTLRLIKQDVKPGSEWHPVDSAWLRKVNVHHRIVEPTVEDSREEPGPLDNSALVDDDYSVCLKRSVVSLC